MAPTRSGRIAIRMFRGGEPRGNGFMLLENLESRRFLSASPARLNAPAFGVDNAPVFLFAPLLAPVSAPSSVAAATVGTTGLKLTWKAPSAVDAPRIAKYQITYTPGAYVAGGGTKTLDISAKSTSATLSSLLSFTLYSID